MRRILSVILCVSLIAASIIVFSACGKEQTDSKETKKEAVSQTSEVNDENPDTADAQDDSYEDEILPEYEVKKCEAEDGAFEVEGKINLYKYDALPDAENVIGVINSYYNIELEVDEETHYENGYGNWFWDNGEKKNPVNASVSMSSKTGKFTLNYTPDSETIRKASENESADIAELEKTATDFVNQFEFVTGRLELSSASEYNDLYYSDFNASGEQSQDIQVKGRRFMFISENYSKQTVTAQDGLECYIECGNSDITERDTQYFVVTMFNDGTIVSADNNITKAPIVSDGVKDMIDSGDTDELLQFFTSTKEDDTLVLRRVYIDSYSNYFGHPEISPVVKIEYFFRSDPADVQTTEIVLEGFFN